MRTGRDFLKAAGMGAAALMLPAVGLAGKPARKPREGEKATATRRRHDGDPSPIAPARRM